MAQRDDKPLMPQGSQTQNFTFLPVTTTKEHPKKFVFVDEHNRHKRLKVMRACEGCRRRKIKCDAATTNSWPCAACVRLKLTCIPPALNFDKSSPEGNGDGSDSSDYGGNITATDEHFGQTYAGPTKSDLTVGNHHVFGLELDDGSSSQPTPDYFLSPGISQPQYDANNPALSGLMGLHYPPDLSFKTSLQSSVGSEAGYRSETHPDELTEHLGDLRISPNAVAPYIANQTRSLADTPAIEELEVELPKSISADMKVRIPSEMMPSESQAMQYFEYFFHHIHPYVPVLSRTYFYQQWQSSRQSISPLILEAIFACASRIMGNENEANQWLALAAKHEESFKDVPRLSTVQAMILLLKAREAVPKRGYYYRSWMTVVNLVIMCKDLNLHEHLEDHQLGKGCGSTPSQCLAKTRVWNTLFILEVMIGGPQGRHDFSVPVDTIDFELTQPIPTSDEAELRTSQQYAHFLRVLRTIRASSDAVRKIKKRSPEWGLDPEFVQKNMSFPPWLQSLPQDFQIFYPDDDQPPSILSHYVANVHSYYHLGVIMQHRPQLEQQLKNLDSGWKDSLRICYAAAKKLCCLQEATLRDYNLPGLLYMLRGINFTIYAVMTCVMVHLVALTSPDSESNEDALNYFPRHMRILEQCMASWPMPELKLQIDSLRQAFSADMNKPFELKATFPFGSPRSTTRRSPSTDQGYLTDPRSAISVDSTQQPTLIRTMSADTTFSDAERAFKLNPPDLQGYDMASTQAPSSTPPGQTAERTNQWNPARLLSHWETAFSTPPSTATSPTQAMMPPKSMPLDGSQNRILTYDYLAPNAINPHPTGHNMFPQMSGSLAMGTMPAVANYVTPSMWREAVAGTYSGQKRRWQEGTGELPTYGLRPV